MRAGDDDSIAGPDRDGDVGGLTDLEPDPTGLPIIAYYELEFGHGRVMRCNDPNCAGRDEQIITQGGVAPSVDVIDRGDGNAAIAYVTDNGLKIIRCNDAACVPTCNGLPVDVDLGSGSKANGADNVIRGTNGDDRIDGRKGNGNDRLIGGPGNDDLRADRGNDRLSGGDGNDSLHGGDGDDLLFGNLGRDQLDGGPGNDTLKGGAWIDSVDGGNGADRCGIVAGEGRVNCERGIFGV